MYYSPIIHDKKESCHVVTLVTLVCT